MRNINVKKFFKSKKISNIIIVIASITLIYLLVSIYFANHFFFNTVINGVNVSLKPYDDANNIIRNYTRNYKLQLIEKNGQIEEIAGQDIGLQYNETNNIFKICRSKSSFKWIISLLKNQKYYVNDLFIYNQDSLKNKINELNCLNKNITESRNVSFKYSNGSYKVVREVYGNKVNRDKLDESIKKSILEGNIKLDLNKKVCYEDPKYTLSSSKTSKTKELLNRYVSTKITYIFENKSEILDGNIINEWLSIDENLEAVIDEKAVDKYVQGLAKKYDTVGITRKFKTSIGKIVEVNGGLYGWKINCADEIKVLLESIRLGEVLKKEPIYIQKSLPRGEDEIGKTYVEVNITRQHLWFYKNGKLITEGDVVTGNPNRGCSTVLGTYMLNYKQNGATLSGVNYETEVSYWMPFFGNIGIHDATWRYSFGGDIYKSNGTHGCVNAPVYLAKAIFDNIEEGTPVICYEE
ncbi:L,D-transpeptidase family protein [Clostridium scatologenes]|uniref:ErfK/YbiS/YcfS/YnhG family protein n=1 Tax=Clostridium scatologenes TaxID=1548 RepID=A0A0E3JNF7_CLOSL|nr:peptidoglycan binding domain-containing protein [Clostridium scatologenes]AKA69217.1 ErfK/YbiS/YcfS/YnhG family protein [Clostridium scatologenes]